MKISIITVVYNGSATIVDTLESVFSQKNIDLEYIIIDGNSTDNTLELINQYKDYEFKIVSESDSGIYDAMNKGIALSSGDIIGFLNSDDLFYNETTLSLIADTFIKNPLAEIVYGDLIYVDKENTNQIVRKWKSNEYYNNYFENGNVPAHPSFYIKRSVLNRTYGFNIKYKFASDYELMFRLLKIEKITSVYLSNVFIRMRLGGKTNNSLGNIINGNIEIFNVWKNYNQKIPLKFWLLRYIKKILQYRL